MRRDNNKFPNNSSLGMVSVFNGATLDLFVSNLTVTFPDLQNERTYTQAQNHSYAYLKKHAIFGKQ